MLIFKFRQEDGLFVQTTTPYLSTANEKDALVVKEDHFKIDYDFIKDKFISVLNTVFTNTGHFGTITVDIEDDSTKLVTTDAAVLLMDNTGITLAVKKGITIDPGIQSTLTYIVTVLKDELKDIILRSLSAGTTTVKKAIEDLKSSLGVGSSSGSTSDSLDDIVERINKETKAEIIKPKETLAEYICNPLLKSELEEICDFFSNKATYKAAGVELPKGILLKGPWGTGKTFAARCIAGSVDCYFMTCTASALQGMYIGSGADNIRKVFKGAKLLAEKSGKGVILFIDEVDSFGDRQNRDAGASGEEDRTLNQLLAEMSGFTDTEDILVLAATNFPEKLDGALMRSGRFGRQITIDYPDEFEREEMIKHYFNKLTIPLDTSFTLNDITALTKGLTPADIKEISNESAILTIRQKLSTITLENINEAINRTITKNIKQPDDLNILGIVSVHECGHVLAEYLYNKTVPTKVTNYSYGDAGGFTQPGAVFTGLITKESYLAQIKILLGGRAAEVVNETCYNFVPTVKTITTGASSDLKRVKQLLYDYFKIYHFEQYDSDTLDNTVLNKLYDLMNEVCDDFETPPNLDCLETLHKTLLSKRVLYTADLAKILAVH